MEKIYFDDSTFIWKTKLNLTEYKSFFLKEAYDIIKSMPDIKTDGYGVKKEWNNDLNFIGEIDIKTKLDEIVNFGITHCKSLFLERGLSYNKINMDAWVNVVRSKEPVQENFHNEKQKYHIHTDINKKMMSFIPNYTYVYYIQMPDVMNNEDGVLYFKGENNREYWIRPEEDDLIIMPGDMPHAPNNAPNSTIDRIVMAGNVGFDYIKKEKSFI
jgi:cupin superfamily acireductone dioxygenase involved in methionine salvage